VVQVVVVFLVMVKMVIMKEENHLLMVVMVVQVHINKRVDSEEEEQVKIPFHLVVPVVDILVEILDKKLGLIQLDNQKVVFHILQDRINFPSLVLTKATAKSSSL
jgi:hypothetical protein